MLFPPVLFRIIEFKDKDTARKAIETMHRYKMKDRNIVVREVKVSFYCNKKNFAYFLCHLQSVETIMDHFAIYFVHFSHPRNL